MTDSECVFVGYLAKTVEPRPDWLRAPGVLDICSVSDCISKTPGDPLRAGRQNAFGFCDSLDEARSVIPAEDQRIDLFAFEFLPLRGMDGRLDAAALAGVAGTVPPDFEFLGYDIVTRSGGTAVECSPLSCNRVAETIPTNSHCLVDGEEQALKALAVISAPGYGAEPGPYYLV